MKNKPSILITGAKGYIGSEVMFRLKLMGLSPIGMDKGDSLCGADIIIHLASNIYGTEKEDFVDEINLSAEVIEKSKRKIIFTSSAAVYGNSSKPNQESQILKPINHYGKTKAMIEQMIMLSNSKHAILRLGNVYSSNATHGFVFNILQGKNILYNNGACIRDYVHLNDVVNTIIEATLTDKWNGIYNIATGKGTKSIDLYQKLSNKTPIFKEREEIKKSILDINKAKKNGFKPLTF